MKTIKRYTEEIEDIEWKIGKVEIPNEHFENGSTMHNSMSKSIVGNVEELGLSREGQKIKEIDEK